MNAFINNIHSYNGGGLMKQRKAIEVDGLQSHGGIKLPLQNGRIILLKDKHKNVEF